MAKITVSVDIRGLTELASSLRRLETQLARLSVIATGIPLLGQEGNKETLKAIKAVGASLENNLVQKLSNAKTELDLIEKKLASNARLKSIEQLEIFPKSAKGADYYKSIEASQASLLRQKQALEQAVQSLTSKLNGETVATEKSAASTEKAAATTKKATGGIFDLTQKIEDAIRKVPVLGKVMDGLGEGMLSTILRFGVVTVLIGTLVRVFSQLSDVFKKSFQNAREFESAFAEVRSILSDVAREAPLADAGIKKLSTSVIQSPQELSKGFYQVVSSGFGKNMTEGLQVLEVAAKAATAGITSSFTAVDVLTTVLLAYGQGAGEAARISDVLFNTVKEGKLVYEDLAQNIGKVIPFAVQLGISFEELSAAVATLTLGGLKPDIAVTALRGALAAVINPTAEASRTARQLGLDFSMEAVQAKGLIGFLDEVKRATGGNEKVMAKLFGEIRGLTAIFALTGEQADEFSRILDSNRASYGATDRAVSEMNDTLDAQWKLIKNKVGPAFTELADNLRDNVKDSLKQINQELELTDFWLDKIGARGAKGLPADIINATREATTLGPFATTTPAPGEKLMFGFKGVTGYAKEQMELEERTKIARALAAGGTLGSGADKTPNILAEPLEKLTKDLLAKKENLAGLQAFVAKTYGVSYPNEQQFKVAFTALANEQQKIILDAFEEASKKKKGKIEKMAADEYADFWKLRDENKKFNEKMRGQYRWPPEYIRDPITPLKDIKFGEAADEVPLTGVDLPEFDRLKNSFTLLDDATVRLVETFSNSTLTWESGGKVLQGVFTQVGSKFLKVGTDAAFEKLNTGFAEKLYTKFGGTGGAFLASGLFIGASKLLGSLFGKKKNEEKDSRTLEKIAINTGDTANYLKEMIGAPSDFATGKLGALAYQGISRQFADSYSRG